MNQIQKQDEVTIDLQTHEIFVNNQRYVIVPAQVQQPIAPQYSAVQHNAQINKSGWNVLQVCGMAILGCVVAILGATALTPTPPPPQIIYTPAPSAPDKTCVFSLGC